MRTRGTRLLSGEPQAIKAVGSDHLEWREILVADLEGRNRHSRP